MASSSTATVLAGLAAVLMMISLFVPWWTGDFEASGSGSSTEGSSSAGPFDDGDLIDESEATTTGILVVVALASFVLAAVVHNLPGNNQVTVMVLLALGALLALLAPLLATTTWPGDDATFWDQSSSSSTFGSAESRTYADAGWYLALVGAVVGLGSAVTARND